MNININNITGFDEENKLIYTENRDPGLGNISLVIENLITLFRNLFKLVLFGCIESQQVVILILYGCLHGAGTTQLIPPPNFFLSFCI